MNEATQRCPRCTETLPLAAFPARHRGKPGNYCTECSRAYMREYQRATYRPKPQRMCATTGCTTTVRGPRTLCVAHTPRPARVLSTTYRAVHGRLWKARGKAAAHTCECGAQAEQWAYNHGGMRELTQEWNGKTVTYSADIEQYDPLCRSCHVKRDSAGYEGGPLHAYNEARRTG